MWHTEAGVREDLAMCAEHRFIILLEARARECLVVARRKPERKRERAACEAHGTKVPKSLSYDPKPQRSTRGQDEGRLTPAGGPQPVMACPVG